MLREIPEPLAAVPARTSAPATLPRRPGASLTRRETRRRQLTALGISLAWFCTHLAAFGIRQDVTRLPSDYIALQIVLPALLGAASLLLAVAPGRLGLGLGVSVVAGLAVLGPLSFWLFAGAAPGLYATTGAGNFWQAALVCLDLTLAWAAGPLLLGGLVLRRSFPAGAGWRSALVGAGLGLFSGAAIDLHCPNVDPAHRRVGHAIPVIVAALVGGAVGSRSARA